MYIIVISIWIITQWVKNVGKECALDSLPVVNAMVVYFHKSRDIASHQQAQNYFREALAHELVQELLDAKEKTHNENADVSASCEFKIII